MALDEPKDTDFTYEEKGLNFVIDNDLLTKLGGVRVDFVQNEFLGGGFSVEGANAPESGGCNEGCC